MPKTCGKGKKKRPDTKAPCPYSCADDEHALLTGVCHEARIVERIDDRKGATAVYRLEATCPDFESCKLQAKVKTKRIGKKTEDGVEYETIPVKCCEAQLYPCDNLSRKQKTKRKKSNMKFKRKSSNYVGRRSKIDAVLGRKRKPRTVNTPDGPLILP